MSLTSDPEPNYTPSGQPYYDMCPPCAAVLHEACVGGEIFCACLAELLMEAEDIHD